MRRVFLLLGLLVGLLGTDCVASTHESGTTTSSPVLTADSGCPGTLTAEAAQLGFAPTPLGGSVALSTTFADATCPSLTVQSAIAADATGSFRLASGTASTLAEVIFTPTQLGPLTAELVLTDDAAQKLTLPLSGTGTAATGPCTPTVLSFGAVLVSGNGVPAQSVTCTNATDGGLTLSASAANTDAQFRVSDAQGLVSNAAESLAPGQTYVTSVTFTPAAVGLVRSSYLFCFDSACDENETVSLSGSGAIGNLAITPSPIAFAADETAQTITLTNVGSASAALLCVSLRSLGASACGQSSNGLSFSGLPALPQLLSPGATVSFSLATATATAADTLEVSFEITGASEPALTTAPIAATP